MVNNNETANVKLSLEQLQNLNTYQERLATLQSREQVVNTHISTLNTEMKKITTERLAAEKHLENLKAEVLVMENKLATITETYNKTQTGNTTLEAEIAEKSKLHAKKEDELKERERTIFLKEKETNEREVNILNVRDDLNNDIRNHKERVAKLAAVLAEK